MVGNAPIIDDNNWQNFLSGSRGFQGMWESTKALALAKPFEELGVPRIPENQWDDIIRQQQRDKATLRDLIEDMGLPHKDQKRTNYCWVFGPTHCCEIIRLQETEIGRAHV